MDRPNSFKKIVFGLNLGIFFKLPRLSITSMSVHLT